jgi:hypothetical protein
MWDSTRIIAERQFLASRDLLEDTAGRNRSLRHQQRDKIKKYLILVQKDRTTSFLPRTFSSKNPNTRFVSFGPHLQKRARFSRKTHGITLLDGTNVRLNWNIESDLNAYWIKFKNFLSLD